MINSPFAPQKINYEGTKKGSDYYITKEIYLKFVQSGTDSKGEPLGEMVPTVREIKTDLQKLIDSHEQEVGVKNLIKIFNRTGDYSLFQARPMLPDGDYTQVLQDPQELLKQLPPELVGNKSVEEFIKTLTPEQFKAWVASLKPAQVVVEDKKGKGEE